MTCEECLHYDVCKALEGEVGMIPASQCGCFKDKTKFIELPCKFGDTVYLKLKGVADIIKGNVRKISFNYKNELVICISRKQSNYYTTGNYKMSSFGKTVFLTPEEAEKALKE